MAARSGLWVEQDRVGPEILEFCGGRVAIFTARGPGKSANEDGLALLPYGEDGGVLAVADGLGGQPGGARAARVALECLEAAVQRARAEAVPLRTAILDGFEQANHGIQDLRIGAGTTLAVLEVAGAEVRAFHVGDSEILAVGQRGKIRLQIVPHSPVGLALEAGWIDDREAMQHDQRHLVTNMVGSPEMRVEMGPRVRLRPRDTVLVASDGLSDNLHRGEIVDLIRCGEHLERARRLVDLCRRRMSASDTAHPSKPDDLTFALFRLD